MSKLLRILCTAAYVLYAVIAYSQGTRISGRVTAADDGSPLPGVNVLLKGTTIGTATDFDGRYALSIPTPGGSLLFSFIGLQTTEAEIGERTVVDVSMIADATQLTEVVVTALGIERQSRELGYAVAGVKSEDLLVARESNILNQLQGKVTGVTITQSSGNLGGSTKILVRGITSLSGRNDPLWVLDGVPINNAHDNTSTQNNRITGNRDFANGASVINPDDVESITVLKGAAATALYGSRAAAGVILVTTKKGKASKGKATVTFNSSLRFDNLFRTPDYQNQYAGGSFFKYDSSFVASSWGERIEGQSVTESLTGNVVPLRAYPNNINDFYRQGKSLINNISFSDGNEKGDYRLSVSSLNQTGILPNAALDRLTASFNAGMKHSEKLKSRFGLQYINTQSQGTGVQGANDPNIFGVASFVRSTNYNNYKPWIDANGNQLGTAGPTDNNPFWIQHENKNERDDERFLANFETTYNPIQSLSFTARVGYDFDNDNRLITNRVGTRSRATGDFLIDKIKRTQANVDIIGTYFKDLNQDFNLKLLGGFNYNKRHFSSETLFSQNLAVPELFNPANATVNTPTRGFAEQVLLGVFGEASLSYKNWATLSLTARNDWSSTLPVDNRSYFYPSASLAVVLTDALDIKSNVLNYAKLRISGAQVGNDTGPYQLDFQFFPVSQATGQYSLNVNFPFAGRLGFGATNTIPAGSALLPEKTTNYEFGTELQFFNSRIVLDAAYFYSSNTDQIISLTIPPSTGFGARVLNAGEVVTSGVEISMDASVVKTSKFLWNSIVNFSHVESTVKRLAPGLDRFLIASEFNNIQVVAVPGKEYQLFGTSYLRDETSGRIIINPQDGLPQAGPLKTFGSVLPDFTMGFINNFSFKGFTLSTTIDWRSGGLISSTTVGLLRSNGNSAETAINREGSYIITAGVLANGDGTFRDNDIPVRTMQTFWQGLAPGGAAEAQIFDASFVKFRELGLSYSFPKSLIGNTFVKGIQVGIEARNLALLYSKVPHIDPEATLFGAGADGLGVERNSVPSTRSIGFNLRITL
ncbi:MAG: SusC/RagA family TonB-linked outer membrane protein [Cyclobacteriaceae bacterium]|nr:SusC/RagA family TonB-linked outer membrane protein [Cyclobacteriaceae bacterium]